MRSLKVATVLFLLMPMLWAQENDKPEEIDPFSINFDDLDTASIFSLLDSLLSDDLSNYKYSQLVLKTGYASQVVSAGRDLGTNQFGVNFGASYYHSSGAYTDVTTYINSENDPKHYLTTATLGYLGITKDNWTYLISYDHYFYREPEDSLLVKLPFSDGIGASIYKSSGKFESGIDYSVIFGDATKAHKVYWTITGTFRKEKFLFFDRIALMPVFGMLFGNESVFSTRFNSRTREEVVTDERNEFGLLNYNLTLPVAMKIKKINFLLSYQYNIPISLPGERAEVSNNSFIGFNISYFIEFKNKKLIAPFDH